MNTKLKKRLKTLNQVVEWAIDKTDTKRILLSTKKPADPAKISKVKDMEMQNAEQQLKFYEEEVTRLENKIEELQGVDKLISKEEELRENKEEINKLWH